MSDGEANLRASGNAAVKHADYEQHKVVQWKARSPKDSRLLKPTSNRNTNVSAIKVWR